MPSLNKTRHSGFGEQVENVKCFPKDRQPPEKERSYLKKWKKLGLMLAMLNNWFDAYVMTVNFTARV